MIKTIDELAISGKRVLMRLDLNVPMDKNKPGVIADATRIKAAMPTINHALEKGAKLIICSHFGRPKGKVDPKYSLQPVAKKIQEMVDREVIFTDDCVGDGIEQIVKKLQGDDQLVILENLRFHAEEEANDLQFSQKLAALAEVYVNDAFGTAHRKHASTYGVAQIVPIRASGFLMKKEIDNMSRLLERPEHPYVAILGGAKVSDKIKTIENLIFHVDSLIIGGAMAYTFLRALGKEVGKSKCEDEAGVQLAASLLKKAKSKNVQILLPIDHVVEKSGESVKEIPSDKAAFDIGSETVSEFSRVIKEAKTIFWNGPMGLFEEEPYNRGTVEIAKAVAASDSFKVAGGGDTVSAISLAAVGSMFDHISTGGGASLEFLEGNSLPGVDAIRTYDKVEQEA